MLFPSLATSDVDFADINEFACHQVRLWKLKMSRKVGQSTCASKKTLNAKHVVIAFTLNLSAMSAVGAQPVGNSPLASYISYGSPCQQSQVRAILESKRPWPNEVRDKRGWVVSFDFWIGSYLFEIPVSNGIEITWGGNGPDRYGISGNAAEIVGFSLSERRNLERRGIGPTLYGRIGCQSHLPSSEWIENKAPNKPSRDELLKDLVSQYDHLMYSGARLFERADIGMVEISYAAKIAGGVEGFYYIPARGDISQSINGKRAVKAISCSSRHDPNAPLSISSVCAIWVYVGPGLWVSAEVYQQYMPLLPSLHSHFVALFGSSRKN